MDKQSKTALRLKIGLELIGFSLKYTNTQLRNYTLGTDKCTIYIHNVGTYRIGTLTHSLSDYKLITQNSLRDIMLLATE